MEAPASISEATSLAEVIAWMNLKFLNFISCEDAELLIQKGILRKDDLTESFLGGSPNCACSKQDLIEILAKQQIAAGKGIDQVNIFLAHPTVRREVSTSA